MPDQPSPVRSEIRGPVLYLTIDRPQRLNALDNQTNALLAEAFDRLRDDPALWLAVIRGAGDKAFSAGADIGALNAATRREADYRLPPSGFGGLTHRFDLDKPVIAAVNGLAMGGGFELALAADIVIAAEHAQFGLPEPRIGTMACGGALQRLPQIIGVKRSMELALGCESISAARALEWGIVNEVVPAAELDEAVDRWVQRLLRAAPLALQASKRCLLQSLDQPLDEAMRRMREAGDPLLQRLQDSRDVREGLAAFAERRQPSWQGA